MNLSQKLANKYVIGISIIMLFITGGIVAHQFYTAIQQAKLSERLTFNLENPVTKPYYQDLVPENTSASINQSAQKAPDFEIEEYTVTSPLPTNPVNLNLYQFKTNFTEQEVTSQLAPIIGPTINKIGTENTILTFIGESGFAVYDLKTGKFQLETYNLKLPQKITDGKNLENARTLLEPYLKNDLKVIDDTVSLTALYNRAGENNITYYEFHRTESSLGLPILNPVGIVQDIEKVSVSELRPGASEKTGAVDETIIYASDIPGRQRQTDFNTFTIAVENGDTILSIDSNIRPIVSTKSLQAQGLSMLTAKDALKELHNNGSYYDIAVPAGEGVISLDKVFINNKLKATEATITQVVLAYLEKPGDIEQTYLQPMLIALGHSQTVTGTRVNFTQSIPILETSERAQAEHTDKENLTSIIVGKLLALISGKAHAQNSNLEEVLVPCDDGSIERCRYIKVRREITHPPTPTLVPPTLTSIPATETPAPPSPTPIPTDVCVIYRSTSVSGREVLEYGRPMFIPGLGTIYYFPQNLPFGPLGVPSSLSIANNWDKVILAFENHLISETARRIIANPSLNYFNNSSNIQSAINLEVIFPEVYSISFHRYIAIGFYQESATRIRQPIYYAHNQTPGYPSMNELAQKPRIALFDEQRTPYTNIWGIHGKKLLARRLILSKKFNRFVISEDCDFASTESPFLYVYSDEPKLITVNFHTDAISYTDPYKMKSLTFTTNSTGGMLFESQNIPGNMIKRDWIHYEYTDTEFSRPETGIVIERSKVEKIIPELGKKIGLTTQESNNLLSETRAALNRYPENQTVFMGIIPESEVNLKIPISFNIVPNSVSRVHLYFEAVTNGKYDTDLVSEKLQSQPIIREGLHVVETGVYAK